MTCAAQYGLGSLTALTDRSVAIPDPLNPSGWARIRACLPAGWQRRAHRHGLCLHDCWRSGRAKFRDPEVLLRLVLYWLRGGSLELTVAQAKARGIVDVTGVGFHYRLRSVGPWLSEIAAGVARTGKIFAPERWGGYRLLLSGASTVPLPLASGVGFLQYRVDAQTLRLEQVLLDAGARRATLGRFEIAEGELDVLGQRLCDADGIVCAVARGAGVIARVAATKLPLLDPKGTRFDAASWVSEQGTDAGIASREVQIVGRVGIVTGRLVVARTTVRGASHARRGLSDVRGDRAGASADRYAKPAVLLTTVAESRLSDDQVVALYRQRRRLLPVRGGALFGGLGRLPTSRTDTLDAWFCGQLLLVAIARRLADRTFGSSVEARGFAHYRCCCAPEVSVQSASNGR